jgi:cytidine deaminase
MPTDPETGLPEVLSQMIYEQGKVIIDAAIDEAVAAERERIRKLAADHATHARPCGYCQSAGREWMPFADLIGDET